MALCSALAAFLVNALLRSLSNREVRSLRIKMKVRGDRRSSSCTPESTSTKIHGDDNKSDNGASKRESKNITHVMSGNTTSRFNGALDYRRWWCVIIIHGHRPSIEAFAECYTVDAFPTLPRQTSSQRGSAGLPYRQLPGPLSPPTLSMFVIGGRGTTSKDTRGASPQPTYSPIIQRGC